MPGGALRCMAAATCVLTAGLATTGCGGDSDGAEPDQAAAKYSMANEPPRTFVERTARLLATARTRRDCAEFDQINGRSLTRFPCPPSEDLSKSMERFEVVGVEEHGSGAIVDYTSGDIEDGAAIVLFVAPDRSWAIGRFGIVTEPSTGTSDTESRDGFRRAVDDYLAAVRETDCEAFLDVAFTTDGNQRELCAAMPRATAGLRKRLRANPDATPRYQGGNETYGFFEFETAKPSLVNTTISVVEATAGSASPYVVLDSAPSPTSKQRQAALELLEEGRRNDEPETSPSRKADDP